MRICWITFCRSIPLWKSYHVRVSRWAANYIKPQVLLFFTKFTYFTQFNSHLRVTVFISTNNHFYYYKLFIHSFLRHSVLLFTQNSRITSKYGLLIHNIWPKLVKKHRARHQNTSFYVWQIKPRAKARMWARATMFLGYMSLVNTNFIQLCDSC